MTLSHKVLADALRFIAERGGVTSMTAEERDQLLDAVSDCLNSLASHHGAKETALVLLRFMRDLITADHVARQAVAAAGQTPLH